MGGNSIKIVFLPSAKGSTLKGKNWLPICYPFSHLSSAKFTCFMQRISDDSKWYRVYPKLTTILVLIVYSDVFKNGCMSGKHSLIWVCTVFLGLIIRVFMINVWEVDLPEINY